MSSEKVVHGIRACVEKFWNDRDFSVMKVDFKNAFNLVSRDAVLQECATYREIGGQKDYAVFGHCVIQCP